jgi:hypothetical protein
MTREECQALMKSRERLTTELAELEDRIRSLDGDILDGVGNILGFEDLNWGPYCEPTHSCPESPVDYCVYSDSSTFDRDTCVICKLPFDRR